MTTAVGMPRFFVSERLGSSGAVVVGEEEARHMRVLRLGAGTPVQLLDGVGGVAQGIVRAIAKRNATIDVTDVQTVAAPPEVHALVPIADRDRMLWLAEKATELELTSWRPVLWKRSRSVSPRGEGAGFQQKVIARMSSALEQSGNAWLPVVFPDATLDRAIASLPPDRRIVLDGAGAPITQALAASAGTSMTIALGPEGGLEDQELAMLRDAGFQPVSLGRTTLRFETAGIAALAQVRASLSSA